MTETGNIVLKVALDGARSIWRRIAIRRTQSLHELALAINAAFNRDNDHLDAFYISPKGEQLSRRRGQAPPAAMRYPHPEAVDPFLARERRERDAEQTPIATLRLVDGQTFYYLFDFGDEWWHIITVEDTRAPEDPSLPYPAVIARRGESPEQYAEAED
jgi:hypothetical protein